MFSLLALPAILGAVVAGNGLIGLLLTIAIVGVICWAITLLPMPPMIRYVIWVVALIAVLIYAVNALGGAGL